MPHTQAGTCVNIRGCEVLLKLVDDPSKNLFLRQSNCGYQGLDPLVCCPNSTGIEGANMNRDFSQMIDSNPLLPKNCGKTWDLGSRIVGGTQAQLGEFPWMALLEYNTRELKIFFHQVITHSLHFVIKK